MALEMPLRSLHALFLTSTIAACVGSLSAASASPATPTSSDAVAAITSLTATVEAITTPGKGWLYRLVYQVHETGGKSGASLVSYHIALSNRTTADGNFRDSGVVQVPHVAANGTIRVETTLSVITKAAAASHLSFTVTYTDDSGQTDSAMVDADISPRS
jgi:hypothetical protein